MSNETLSHHGILGMRWGVRKYQNKDGSLTPLGKKRANKLKKDYERLTNKPIKDKYKSPKNWKELATSKPRNLNDDDLNKQYNRLYTENEVLDLKYKVHQKTQSKGSRMISTIGRNVLAPALINSGKKSLEGFFKKKFDDLLYKTYRDDKKKLKKDYNNGNVNVSSTLKNLADTYKNKNKSKNKGEKVVNEVKNKSINNDDIIRFEQSGQAYFDFDF